MSQDPDYEARMERAQIAFEAMQDRTAKMSGTECQPMILWTRRAMSWPEVREIVEGRGQNPYRMLYGTEFPFALRLTGHTPTWARKAYIVFVEIQHIRVS